MDREALAPRWQRRFKIIDQIDGDFSRTGELLVIDRLKIGFRLFAFLFGPFYYLVYAMWHKALAMIAIVIACSTVLKGVEAITHTNAFQVVFTLGLGVFCGVSATRDYYKKAVNNENLWPFMRTMPDLFRTIPGLVVLVLLLFIARVYIGASLDEARYFS